MAVNKAIIGGRLTKDVEVKTINDTIIANFSVAVTRGKDDKTDFINCVAFGKNAENIGKFFQKGKYIIVIGKIQTGSYQHANGHTVYTTDIAVETWDFGGATKGDSLHQGFSPPATELIIDSEDLPF